MIVPNCREKIRYLLSRHVTVNTRDRLAAELGISGPRISQFFTDDEIPDNHVSAIAVIYDFEPAVLELQSLILFKERVERSAAVSSRWRVLKSHAMRANGEVQVRKQLPKISERAGERGLVLDDGPEERFRIGDRVRIEVNWDFDWYAVCILEDRQNTSCLCPSDFAFQCKLNDGVLLVPPITQPKSLKFEGVPGQYMLFVVVLMRRLPDYVEEALIGGATELTLEKFAATVMQRPADQWAILKKPIPVDEGRDRG